MSDHPLIAYQRKHAGDPSPKRGQRPDDVVLILFADFELRGTRLGFSEPWAILDAVPVFCPSGSYVLVAECLRYGNDCRIARVTATRARRTGVRGALYGAIDVDVGNACVFDYDAIEGYADSDENAFENWIDANIVGKTTPFAGSVACDSAKTTIEFVTSGFGDGTYSVYELRDDYDIVGAEVVFLDTDEPYPFGA